MLGFQFTKWFWSLWDHLLTIVLWNLMYLSAGGLFFFLLRALTIKESFLSTVHPALSGIALCILLFLSTILQHACALSNYSIAKFESSKWKDSLRRAFRKDSLLAALLLDFGIALLSLIFFFGWHFYSRKGDLLSLTALGLLFWMALLILLSFGFYFPILVREKFSVPKALRQSLLVCLDNLPLSLILGLTSCVLFLMSFLPPLMLFFGPMGLGLWYEVSIHILYYKYQYLETLSQEKSGTAKNKRRKVNIPWFNLLVEERERIGPRTLSNFIFPWKD
ncbi:hypothetical protein P0082_00100 [Candidatus Haliotispira prima]|uniref:Uncharacterized protein n=1 Tax=Candidatus Haliotispira prima TaxID=3034016 RepID=A0ABY8MJB1_9SPIO|nr:hypothetical protein P0082_00100 [Candidatus Haliotispira prima]